jgi:hypothetical protein
MLASDLLDRVAALDAASQSAADKNIRVIDLASRARRRLRKAWARPRALTYWPAPR